MLIVGDISGIQDYLFDLNNTKAGQSRRLRARSFYLQTLTETSALKLLNAIGWQLNQLVFSAAGKFLLQGDALTENQEKLFEGEVRKLSDWALKRTGARVRLSIVCSSESTSVLDQYNSAMKQLQKAKSRPLSLDIVQDGKWNVLPLEGIFPPCAVCYRLKAEDLFLAESNDQVCHGCNTDLRIGKELPHANWLELRNSRSSKTDDLFSLEILTHANCPTCSAETFALFDLNSEKPESFDDPPRLHRRLGRYTPEADFDKLAEGSQGVPYLGILKMDADSLGLAVNTILGGATDFAPLRQFSAKLDEFFARKLQEDMKRNEWKSLYTVFSGGDDLLIVGPWDVSFRFARHVQKEFVSTFHEHGLTISAGLAIVPSKTPIRRSVEAAEMLLEEAKRAGKNRFATFGQVWKWEEHDTIQHSMTCLVHWVKDNSAERGWLQTLLQMTEQLKTEPITTARLVYHIERNYPRVDSDNPQKNALRNWINLRVQDFDNPRTPETRYLPAILRYALNATRKTEKMNGQ